MSDEKQAEGSKVHGFTSLTVPGNPAVEESIRRAAEQIHEHIASEVSRIVKAYLAIPGHERERELAEQAARLTQEVAQLKAEAYTVQEIRHAMRVLGYGAWEVHLEDTLKRLFRGGGVAPSERSRVEELDEYLHDCNRALAEAGHQVVEGPKDGIVALTNERDTLAAENARMRGLLDTWRSWFEASADEQECSADEDCDHCFALSLIEDAKALSIPASCASCGKPMEDRGAETQWCSGECREKWQAARKERP